MAVEKEAKGAVRVIVAPPVVAVMPPVIVGLPVVVCPPRIFRIVRVRLELRLELRLERLDNLRAAILISVAIFNRAPYGRKVQSRVAASSSVASGP